MIEAKISGSAQAFTSRAAAKAQTIADAHGENAVRQRRRDPHRWRKPALLWPLFASRFKGGE